MARLRMRGHRLAIVLIAVALLGAGCTSKPTLVSASFLLTSKMFVDRGVCYVAAQPVTDEFARDTITLDETTVVTSVDVDGRSLDEIRLGEAAFVDWADSVLRWDDFLKPLVSLCEFRFDLLVTEDAYESGIKIGNTVSWFNPDLGVSPVSTIVPATSYRVDVDPDVEWLILRVLFY